MHVLPNPEQEQQADLFAAELLMPADDIRPQLDGLTTGDLHRLLELKAQWKVLAEVTRGSARCSRLVGCNGRPDWFPTGIPNASPRDICQPSPQWRRDQGV